MLKKTYNQWGIQQIWNEELEKSRQEIKPRDYISASDIGKPYLDRYLKMMGEQETNPYEPRVLRIFSAGEEFHLLLRRVFRRIGLLIDYEQQIKIPRTETSLPILGHYDLKLGGKINLEQAIKSIEEEDFTEFVKEKAKKVAEFFAQKYPEGFEPLICEIKSVNSLAFWAHQQGKGYLKTVYPHHALQLYTYLKALNLPVGRLLYISKDDLTLEEHTINYPNPVLEEKWQEDVKTMSYYYLRREEPPKEPDIVFDEEKGKWVPNWRVGRSTYLTRITGMTKEEWEKYTLNLCKEKNKELRAKKQKKVAKSK